MNTMTKAEGRTRPARSKDKPSALREALPGEASKECRMCERNIPLSGYSKNSAAKDKLANRCRDCEYIANTTGLPFRVVQEGPPLKRAYYEEVVVNGARIMKRVIR